MRRRLDGEALEAITRRASRNWESIVITTREAGDGVGCGSTGFDDATSRAAVLAIKTRIAMANRTSRAIRAYFKLPVSNQPL